jgi:D-alanyl-D-alanine carboxypeptidase (penicillin-binding protein 5/6)
VARVPWVDGVKTGHTLDAGYVLVGAGARKGAQLVSVVLGDSSEAARDADTLALLRYGFGFYRRVPVVRDGQRVGAAAVEHFGGRLVTLVAGRGVSVTVRRGQRLRTKVDASLRLEGPLAKGERVGTATVIRDGRPVRTVPIVTAEAVPAAGFLRKHAEWLIALVGAVVAVLVGLRLRARQKHGGRARGVVT